MASKSKVIVVFNINILSLIFPKAIFSWIIVSSISFSSIRDYLFIALELSTSLMASELLNSREAIDSILGSTKLVLRYCDDTAQ